MFDAATHDSFSTLFLSLSSLLSPSSSSALSSKSSLLVLYDCPVASSLSACLYLQVRKKKDGSTNQLRPCLFPTSLLACIPNSVTLTLTPTAATHSLYWLILLHVLSPSTVIFFHPEDPSRGRYAPLPGSGADDCWFNINFKRVWRCKNEMGYLAINTRPPLNYFSLTVSLCFVISWFASVLIWSPHFPFPSHTPHHIL